MRSLKQNSPGVSSRYEEPNLSNFASGKFNQAPDTTMQLYANPGIPDLEIRDKKAFEWVFGRNKDGELSLGVSKNNALVPSPTLT